MSHHMRYIVCFSAALFLAGCAPTHTAQKDNTVVIEKVAHIENEPITRLSFVPVHSAHDDIEIVVHRDAAGLNDVRPASGAE